MIVQINTDKNITGREGFINYFKEQIDSELHRFSEHITRVEVYLTDENGPKGGVNNIKCVLEARLEGRPPVAVNGHADTSEKAIWDTLEKLKASLDTIMGKAMNHR